MEGSLIHEINFIGHARPLCTFASRLLQERPLYITFFTGPNFVKRVEDELSRNLVAKNDQAGDLIRYMDLYFSTRLPPK